MNDNDSAMVRDALCCAADQALYQVQLAASEYQRPVVFMRPKIYKDGGAWCALYGENLMEGVVGFGDTPAKAAHDFDVEWLGKSQIKEEHHD